MAPYELRNLTIRQLGKIRNGMAKPAYLLSLDKLPPEKQHESDFLQHQVQMALLKMRAAELDDLRDQLALLEAELTAGASRVEGVLADLQKTEEILRVVNGFLGVVGRIITLV